MLTAVASVKGAPGTTTFALALALRWPQQALLVEADPGGGDLGDRFGQPDLPGLASLVVAARREYRSDLLYDHAYRLPLGVDVVIAPASGRRAAAAVAELPAQALASSDVDVVVDLGRVWDGSPADGLVPTADALLVVCGADLASVDHTGAYTVSLSSEVAARTSVVVVGDCRYRPQELAEVFEVPVAVVVPPDRRGAATLSGVGRAVRGWDRVGLPAAARTVALDLHRRRSQGQLTSPVVVVEAGHLRTATPAEVGR